MLRITAAFRVFVLSRKSREAGIPETAFRRLRYTLLSYSPREPATIFSSFDGFAFFASEGRRGFCDLARSV